MKIRVFVLNGLVEGIKSNDPDADVEVEIVNCDDDMDDMNEYDKLWKDPAFTELPVEKGVVVNFPTDNYDEPVAEPVAEPGEAE